VRSNGKTIMARYSQHLGNGVYAHYSENEMNDRANGFGIFLLGLLFAPFLIIALVITAVVGLFNDHGFRNFFLDGLYPALTVSIVVAALTFGFLFETRKHKFNKLNGSALITASGIIFKLLSLGILLQVVFLGLIPLLVPHPSAWFTYYIPGFTWLVEVLGIPLGIGILISYIVRWKRKRLAVWSLITYVTLAIITSIIVYPVTNDGPLIVSGLLGWFLLTYELGKMMVQTAAAKSPSTLLAASESSVDESTKL
jgi:hypothetical protein